MNSCQITRYFHDTRLTNYLTIPLEALKLELPSTALLLYGLLLHRGLMSQRNGFADEAGWIYVVFILPDLAKELGTGVKMVQKHLKALEEAGLILRKRPVGNRASHIYLCIPATSEKYPSEGTFPGTEGNNSSPWSPKKVPSRNNTKKETELSIQVQCWREFMSMEVNFALMQRKQEAFGDCRSLYESTFAADCGLVPQMKEARRYADNFDAMRRNRLGLLLWGPPGNGKTYAAAAIANLLLERKDFFPPTVRMTNFASVLAAMLAASPQGRVCLTSRLLECDLLILDDFGMERQTDYAREQIFHIVDGRYQRGAPVIVTTNLSLSQLKDPQTLADRRICDRLLEMCVPVYFPGESLRQGKAKENLKRYRQLVTDGNS